MSELLDVLRTEQKYLINQKQTIEMSALLSKVLMHDTYSTQGSYMVRSLYFDTPDDRDYFNKIDGLENRRKIRLRIYDINMQSAKLELKEKEGSMQRKRSLNLSREEAILLSLGDYSPLLQKEDLFAKELYGRLNQFSYRPKCIVEYDREAFVVPANDTRVTLDSNLRASLTNLELFSDKIEFYPVGILGQTTMEVKYNNFLLSYVKNLVSIPSYMQTSASKYVMSRNKTLRNML